MAAETRLPRARVVVFVGIGLSALCAHAASPDPPVLMPNRSAEVNIQHTFTPNTTIAPNQVWMSAGGAVADFNNNGLPDVFLLSGGHEPDRLYINNGDGTFTDQAAEWGVAVIHAGTGAAAADFNNNGYIDIYVTSFGNIEDGGPTPGRNKLYRNNGDGTFTEVAEEAGVAWVHETHPCGYGPAWGDYNLNGHLDLYVPTWWASGTFTDVLFRNNGDGTFTNVTVEAGVYDPTVWGFQAAFADMNGNGWPDLLVAADFFTSRYYVNNGDGTFTDYTTESGTGLDSNGMGHAIADVNNNGLLDWYVTSIWPDGPNPGNMLYLNQGDHLYIESGQKAGVHDGAWGWGAIAVDLDNKGWVDLIEVNGRFSWPYQNVPPRLFYNNADGTFTDIASIAGMTHGDLGRGIARLDADRNGRQDILVMNYTQPVRYYRNETPDPGNWLVVEFDTSTNPYIAPNGDGSVDSLDLLLLLGHWGEVTSATGMFADLNNDGSVDSLDLLLLLSNWGM